MKKRPAGKKFGKKLSLNKERVRELSADELNQVHGAATHKPTCDLFCGKPSGACVSEGC